MALEKDSWSSVRAALLVLVNNGGIPLSKHL